MTAPQVRGKKGLFFFLFLGKLSLSNQSDMHPCSSDMICWFEQRYTLSPLVKQALQHACLSACNFPAQLDLISILWKYLEVCSANRVKWCMCADNNTGTCFQRRPDHTCSRNLILAGWETESLNKNSFVFHVKLFKEPWKNEMTSRFADGCIRGRHFFGAAATCLFLRFTEQIWKHHDCQSINMFSLVM